MLSISAPLTSQQLGGYFKAEYSASSASYYSESGVSLGEWHGQIAAELGLEGQAVEEWEFRLLIHGADPRTGAQLIEHRVAKPVELPTWITDDARWREKLEEMFETAVLRHGPTIVVASPGTADILTVAKREGALDLPSWSDQVRNPLASTSSREPETVSLQSLYEMQMGIAVKAAPEVRYAVAVELAERLGIEAPEKLPEVQKRMEHRGGWDLTFSAPKSFSVMAVEDPRLRDVHRRALAAALTYAESRTSAHFEDRAVPTGRWIVAVFEHDTSRPEKGYAAPQIHSHVIVINMTMTADWIAHALEPKEWYAMQDTLTWVYRTHLRDGLTELGYSLEPAEHGGFEIKGFTREYLESESPRRMEILRRLEELGLSGARAAEIVAHQNRGDKLLLSKAETVAMHRAHAEEWGRPAVEVLTTARARGPYTIDRTDARAAVSFALHHIGEKLPVIRHDKIVAHALRYGWQSGIGVKDVEREIQRRVETKELVQVYHAHRKSAAPRYATAEMRQMERDIITIAVSGRNKLQPVTEQVDWARYPALADNPQRQEIIRRILATCDQTVILQGSAGVGKSYSVIRIVGELAQENGYDVLGLAPTGVAVNNLKEIGIAATTLQGHNASGPNAGDRPRFYLVDETTLASTRDLGQFFRSVRPQDRVLLVGDDSPKRKVSQHHAVEAGRVFRQLQDAGIPTAQLNKILRQKEAWLLNVVRDFRNGETSAALKKLDERGKLLDYFATPAGRYAHIAKEYAKHPDRVVVVSPDNKSRREINTAIRAELRRSRRVSRGAEAQVLVVRDPDSKANLRLASTYKIGDHLRYLRGSGEIGITARQYGQVVNVERVANRLTVRMQDGHMVTYDPQKLSKVSLYEEMRLSFGIGDRIQFTAPFREKGIRTRQLGTVKAWDGQEFTVSLDNGKTVRWSVPEFRHIDHAYAFTSHSVQSVTAARALVNIDTSDHRLRSLLNQTFAYVANSRPEYDLQIFTDDKQRLAQVLSRSEERHTALSHEETRDHAQAVST